MQRLTEGHSSGMLRPQGLAHQMHVRRTEHDSQASQVEQIQQSVSQTWQDGGTHWSCSPSGRRPPSCLLQTLQLASRTPRLRPHTCNAVCRVRVCPTPEADAMNRCKPAFITTALGLLTRRKHLSRARHSSLASVRLSSFQPIAQTSSPGHTAQHGVRCDPELRTRARTRIRTTSTTTEREIAFARSSLAPARLPVTTRHHNSIERTRSPFIRATAYTPSVPPSHHA